MNGEADGTRTRNFQIDKGIGQANARRKGGLDKGLWKEPCYLFLRK